MYVCNSNYTLCAFFYALWKFGSTAWAATPPNPQLISHFLETTNFLHVPNGIGGNGTVDRSEVCNLFSNDD